MQERGLTPVSSTTTSAPTSAQESANFSVNSRSATGGAPIAAYNSQQRLNYSNAAAKLEPLYSETDLTPSHISGVDQRTAMKESTRASTIGGRAHLDRVDPVAAKYSNAYALNPDGTQKANPRFFKTNSGVNTLAKISRVGGVAGVGLSVYELGTAAQDGRFIQQAQIEGGKLGGAWAGMKAASGVVAFSPIPVTKTPVGAIIIVGAGGVAGSIGGEQAVKYIQNLNPVNNEK